LSLDYRPMEIIVINDRSIDGTGKILEEMVLHMEGNAHDHFLWGNRLARNVLSVIGAESGEIVRLFYSPFLSRCTCSTRLSVPTCDN
jgi:hypothetical protein